jgi:hypothetical protein
MDLDRANPDWQPAFLKWLTDGNWEFKAFDRIAGILESRVKGYVLRDREFSELVAEAIPAVLGNCDEMDFNAPGEAEAYSILHFLDRYHRFQINFRAILESGRWPRLDQRCVCIDIGTGPAPALFAISDFCRLISQFSVESGYDPLHEKHLSLDYVEQSEGFRNWLHGFTEFADTQFIQFGGVRSGVPFHHGTFRDFNKMEFSEPRYGLDIRGENWIRMPKDRKHRFNIVIASNFFTSAESVAKFGKKLQQAALYTKNRGLLIFVGAVSRSPQYREVYKHLDKLILGQDYCQGRYVGSFAKIGFPFPIQSYCWSDPIGKRLKRLLAMVLKVFKAHGVLEAIEPKTLAMLQRTVLPEYDREAQWELHSYNRQSQLKHYRRKRKQISKPLSTADT